MIYSLPSDAFPALPGRYRVKYDYKDQSDQKWGIAFVENGFFVQYQGDASMMNKIFVFQILEQQNHREVQINNTGCYFIASTGQDADLEKFSSMKYIIENSTTQNVFSEIGSLIRERIRFDGGITEAELIT